MADNLTLNSGSGGATLAADDIAGIHHQRVKIQHGADGSATDVSTASPLPISDAGGSLTVDNATLAVVGGGTEATAMRVTIASDSTGVLSVDDNGGSLTVDSATLTTIAGAVSGTEMQVDVVAALPAGTNAIGKLAANSGVDIGDVDVTSVTPGTTASSLGKAEDAGHSSGDVGVMALAVRSDSDASLCGTDLDYTPLQTDSNGYLKVNIKAGAGSGGTSATDDAAFTAASGSGTPIMGFATADTVDSGDVGVLAMDTSRRLKIAVDAALPAGTNNIGDVDVLTVPTDPFGANADAASATGSISAKLRYIASTGIPVTNAGTFATQESGAALTALQLIDDAIVADDAAFTPATTKVMMAGFEYDDTTPDSVNEGDAGAARMSANRNLYTQIRDAAGNERGVNINASNQMSVSVDAALPAGTNAIGKLASNTGVTIGAVELAASQTLATVTTVSTLTGGGVAHDGADSGNPHKIGAKAETSLSGGTLVADGDRTDLYAGVDGVLIVRPHSNLEDVVQERATNTDGASTAFASGLAAPGAGIRIWLTSITISNSSSSFCTVDIRDGSAGSVLWTFPVPATGGVTHTFNPPLKFTANTAVAYDASAATTTLTISANGFKSKV